MPSQAKVIGKMPAYFPIFVAGERIRIKPASTLRDYMLPNWPWHHPITADQLGFAGTEANYVQPFGFHLLRLGVNGQSERRSK